MYTEKSVDFSLVEFSQHALQTPKFNFDFSNHDEECVYFFFVHRPTIRVDEMNFMTELSVQLVLYFIFKYFKVHVYFYV